MGALSALTSSGYPMQDAVEENADSSASSKHNTNAESVNDAPQKKRSSQRLSSREAAFREAKNLISNVVPKEDCMSGQQRISQKLGSKRASTREDGDMDSSISALQFVRNPEACVDDVLEQTRSSRRLGSKVSKSKEDATDTSISDASTNYSSERKRSSRRLDSKGLTSREDGTATSSLSLRRFTSEANPTNSSSDKNRFSLKLPVNGDASQELKSECSFSPREFAPAEDGANEMPQRRSQRLGSQRSISKHSTTSGDNKGRIDTSVYLSAVAAVEESQHGENQGPRATRPGFPLPLMGLVTVLAAVAGFAVVGFNLAIVYAGCPLGINGCNEFYHKEDKGFKLIKALKGSVPEDIVYVIVAAVGALLVIQICTRVPDEIAFQACGGGTLQSLEAVATGHVIPFSAAVLRVITSVIYSGSGGTLGMEGPVIQICTILATNAGWALGIRAPPTQSVLASLGFACGFAASFNSPLAGILFAMEELQHVTSQFSRGITVMILVASIAPTVVVRACKGNVQKFQPSWADEIIHGNQGGSLDQVFGEQLWMLIAIPIAMMCSVVNLAIVLSLRHLNAAMDVLYRRFEWLPVTIIFVVQTILIACIGVLVFRVTGLRGIWGIGVESVQKALSEDFQIHEYFLFGLAKCLAMVMAVVVRAPGDVLEPVLITGAFLGGGVGRCLIDWFGLGAEVMTPSIIFGMIGLFASCFRFPLTPVVIVIELMGTDAYSLVIPMVLASFTAVVLSSRLCCPILAELECQDGIDVHGQHRTSEDTEEAGSLATISELDVNSQISEKDMERRYSDPPLSSKTSDERSERKTSDPGFGFALGGMVEQTIKALSSMDDGFCPDYAFARQATPSSDDSISAASPTSPKDAWAQEPDTPKTPKAKPLRRQKTKVGIGGKNKNHETPATIATKSESECPNQLEPETLG